MAPSEEPLYRAPGPDGPAGSSSGPNGSLDALGENALKIILLGDSACGKSKLVERFLLNNYQSRQLSTYALTLFRHNATVDGQKVEIDFWDTAGQESAPSHSALGLTPRVWGGGFGVASPASQAIGAWLPVAASPLCAHRSGCGLEVGLVFGVRVGPRLRLHECRDPRHSQGVCTMRVPCVRLACAMHAPRLHHACHHACAGALQLDAPRLLPPSARVHTLLRRHAQADLQEPARLAQRASWRRRLPSRAAPPQQPAWRHRRRWAHLCTHCGARPRRLGSPRLGSPRLGSPRRPRLHAACLLSGLETQTSRLLRRRPPISHEATLPP